MIDADQRRALTELRRLDWAPTAEDVWTSLDIHLDALNGAAGAAVLRAFDDADVSRLTCPLGLVVEGQHGSGKTHLLRWAREKVQLRHGYFFLMGVADGRSFWANIVHTFLRGLRRAGSYRHSQLAVLVERLSERARILLALRQQVRGQQPLTPAALDTFVAELRNAEPEMGRECRHTLRALVLLASSDDDIADLGESWLMSLPDLTASELVHWGLPARVKNAEDVAGEISRLLACTGASMLAVDQIDVIFAQSRPNDRTGIDGDAVTMALAADLGNGLMDLREKLFRTVTVVACLPRSWELIKKRAVMSVSDRFREETRLHRLPSQEIAEELIGVRFAPFFEAAEFKPPYPTWPILPEAFAEALDYTPRQLIEHADEHVRRCLSRDEVVPLAGFGQHRADVRPGTPAVEPGKLAAFDERFAQLRAAADVEGALRPATEDAEMSRLLEAGLRAWTVEQGERAGRYKVQPGEPGRPAAHALLRELLDDETEDEAHWSFRGLSHLHHRAVQARMERLRGVVNLDPAVSKRRAVVLRNEPWPNGPVSRRVLDEFLDLGGMVTDVSTEDLRTFAALAELLIDGDAALADCLRTRRPASRTSLFAKVFGSPPGQVTQGPASIPLGTVAETQASVRVPLESLRKHSVIFAGSGSGKTVLIRRLVEESALHGVSAIVLDPNNDLARLGDAWPEPPPSWRGDDAAKAQEYLAGTDVVVWTPRREAGRPLSLQPLPDFSAVLDEPDEFALALDAAVATLAPRARMAAGTAKADRGRAVLRQALQHFGRHNGGGLDDFVELLTDLPDEATSLSRAREVAADMAETLKAAMVNDPLFGGAGAPLDPGVLLTPAEGRRSRVSVISLIGLPGDEQRQSFVNQLQMALFAWIKRHPAGNRPLGGLFVMDEAQNFAPSGAMTACTESTLALASQARKYGLGLVFATQAPKGIHNRIVGNAATQFYGFLNSPTQIAAAKEVAQAKGSAVLDISRLRAGQFYTVTEGAPFRKVNTPMCLTHHPTSALTAEEVLVRARR
ncbi:helicase HerA domain-containing protein [Actinoplanes sp. NPDC049681]|uniref:helicase HerA domain-containing protein n=1 Tax=Actinoplanes sp. NPDC049681 TaxID=3363905 RepID=UPI0037967C27